MKGRVEAEGSNDHVLLEINEAVRRGHDRAHVHLTFFSHSSAAAAGLADSAWANRPDGSSQGGRTVAAVNTELPDEVFANVSLISWESKKLPRKACSAPCAETQAMSELVGEVDYVRSARREFTHEPTEDLKDHAAMILGTPGCVVTNC